MHYLVRTGVWGSISQYRAVDGSIYPPNSRVICETSRGLEIGQIISETDSESSASRIIRQMSSQDELLETRLVRYKCLALEQCRDRLEAAGIESVLLDVEHLFDGRTLVFHFLGDVTPSIESITEELAEVYEQQVRSRHFAKLLAEGCGPNCGTSEGSGCSGGCAVCVVASSCNAK